MNLEEELDPDQAIANAYSSVLMRRGLSSDYKSPHTLSTDE